MTKQQEHIHLWGKYINGVMCCNVCEMTYNNYLIKEVEEVKHIYFCEVCSKKIEGLCIACGKSLYHKECFNLRWKTDNDGK